MAKPEIEIDVVLNGAKEAAEGLDQIGETSEKLVSRFQTENEKLGEGLSSITKNVKALGGSFVGLDNTVRNLGKSGAASLASLLPAFAGVAAAV